MDESHRAMIEPRSPQSGSLAQFRTLIRQLLNFLKPKQTLLTRLMRSLAASGGHLLAQARWKLQILSNQLRLGQSSLWISGDIDGRAQWSRSSSNMPQVSLASLDLLNSRSRSFTRLAVATSTSRLPRTRLTSGAHGLARRVYGVCEKGSTHRVEWFVATTTLRVTLRGRSEIEIMRNESTSKAALGRTTVSTATQSLDIS